MRRFLGMMLALSLLCIQLPSAKALNLSAASAILLDADSGRVLYAQNADEPRLIASTTKLMTALVAAESGHDLQETVTIQPEWVGVEGSSIYLRAGEQVTLETLLYGMLLRSGNDAATAVAGFCGGSEDAFVRAMNEKAQSLGMTHSHFANPHGLNAEDHYASAHDMALLAGACLKNETVAGIVSTKSITLGTRTFTNHNKLLWRYPGCVGMKTGFTEKAGRTLVSAARRGDTTLICVTLNAPDDWRDHAALFDYGFEAFQTSVLVQKEAQLGALPVEGSLCPTVPILAGETVALCLKAGETVTSTLSLHETLLSAPVAAGTEVGEVVYCLDGREVGRTPLVTGCAVASNTQTHWNWMQEFQLRLRKLTHTNGRE